MGIFLLVGLTWLGTVPILALLRRLLAARVQRFMMARAGHRTAPALPDEDRPEIPAGTRPRIGTRNVDSLPKSAQKAGLRAFRESRSRARRHGFGLLLVDILMMLVYGLVLGLASAVWPSEFDLRRGSDAAVRFLDAGGIGLIIGLYPVVQSILRLLLGGLLRLSPARAPKGARHLDVARSMTSSLQTGWLRLLLHPRWGFLLLALLGAGAILLAWVEGEVTPLSAAAFLLALCLHSLLRGSVVGSLQDAPNCRLLILRVFEMDRSAVLTFGYMLDYWRHFGSSFTIVDPSYVRFRLRSGSGRNVALSVVVAFGTWGMLEAGWLSLSEYEAYGGPMISHGLAWGLCVLGLGYGLYGIVLWRAVPRDFAWTAETLSQRLAGLESAPLSPDVAFRGLHLSCHDDTWRTALSVFVAAADVVLMDLRGYSEDRKGCEYEVDYLFDVKPIDRIVFLVDGTEREKAVAEARRLIYARWEHLRAGSPNLDLPDPVAWLYASSDESPDDVLALSELLLAAGRGALPSRRPRIAPSRQTVPAASRTGAADEDRPAST